MRESCPECKGSGYSDTGLDPYLCGYCHGDGEIVATDLSRDGDYNLSTLRVMHMLYHGVEVDVEHMGATVRRGFKWADSEDEGVFLCSCVDRCLDPDLCGRSFADAVDDKVERNSRGHAVQLKMPWTDEHEQVVFNLWCCDNCGLVGTAGVTDVWAGRFFDVPARLLQWEHDKEYGQLFESLKKAYGSFGEGSMVSVVLYRRTS